MSLRQPSRNATVIRSALVLVCMVGSMPGRHKRMSWLKTSRMSRRMPSTGLSFRSCWRSRRSVGCLRKSGAAAGLLDDIPDRLTHGKGTAGRLDQRRIMVSMGIPQGWVAAAVNGAVFVYAARPAVRRAYIGQ